jgi:hypothetical protein
MAFRSGSALTVLDALVSSQAHGVPVKLLANRLALKAAAATSRLEGRLAPEADIRDAYHLAPPGAALGPDGDLLDFWRNAVRARMNRRGACAEVERLIVPDLAGEVDGWLRTGAARAETHGPLAGCISVMRAVLQTDDRAERVACLLSDVILARALKWASLLPVSAGHFTKVMMLGVAMSGEGAELAAQGCLLESLEEAIRLARNLAQRAEALQTVAPRLRAKGSGAAVDLFLSEDAVAPASTLSPMIKGTAIRMSDRAARRLCDRLVELGVARELTGRPTFRLYGIAS